MARHNSRKTVGLAQEEQERGADWDVTQACSVASVALTGIYGQHQMEGGPLTPLSFQWACLAGLTGQCSWGKSGGAYHITYPSVKGPTLSPLPATLPAGIFSFFSYFSTVIIHLFMPMLNASFSAMASWC